MPFDASTLAAATAGTFVGSVFSDTFITSGVDVDIVALTLEADRTYQIDVDNGTAGDLYLRIFDQFGNEVRANDDGFRSNDDVVFANSPFIEFVPNLGGLYYFAISPYYLANYDPFTTANRNPPVNPIAATAGTLTVTQVAFAAQDGLFATAGTIASASAEGLSDETDAFRDEDGSLRVAYSGVVNSAGDVDIGRIDTVKGDVFVFDVNGLTGNGTVLRVFNSAGTVLLFNDDGGTGDDPEGVYAAPFALAIYVAVTGEGNEIYDPLDGSDTLAGVTGEWEIIIHKNPDLIGTNLNNSFVGNSAANYFVGLAENDTLFGNDGDDTLSGGDDRDSLNGGSGRDVLYGDQGNDTLLGGTGNDVLSGGLGNDRLDGNEFSDLLSGGAGDDVLFGGTRNYADTLQGDAGDDQLSGDSGNDLLQGGVGNDTLLGGVLNDTLQGGEGNDSLSGETWHDVLQGGDGADTLFGDDGFDTLAGDAGNDALFGGLRQDTLSGGIGDDNLSGDAGNDLLSGGAGNDTLIGGTGGDIFIFETIEPGVDLITDFTLALDRIDLSQIFSATGSIVTGANLSSFVQVTNAGVTDTFLGVDADGLTGGLNFTIIARVTGISPVQMFDAANFIL